MVDSVAEKYGDRIAYIDGAEQYSYARLKHDVYAMAAYLVENGFSGKHIGILGANSYKWIVAYLAIMSGVGVCVPLPTGLPEQNIRFMVKLADVDAVISDKPIEGLAHIPFGSGSEASLEIPDAQSDDFCKIIFTSGTTGMPKCVMLNQDNIICIANCEFIPLAGMVSIAVLPMYHAFESVCQLLPILNNGGTVYTCASLMQFAPLVAKSGCDSLFLVPALAEALLTKFRKFLDMATSLKAIVCGGAAVPQALVDAYKALGIRVITGYGLSECSPLVSLNVEARPSSCGVIGSYCTVRIAEDGEIQVKGRNVTKGYYKNEQATRDVFTPDGWLKTGDLGELKDGNLYLTGRIKNLIILSNGENVSPEELENLLIDNITCVSDALVFEKNGLLAARLVITDAQADYKAELDKLNAGLPGYKRIQNVEVTAEPLEVNATGKKKR